MPHPVMLIFLGASLDVLLLFLSLIPDKHDPIINVLELSDEFGKNGNAFDHQIPAFVLLPQDERLYGSPHR